MFDSIFDLFIILIPVAIVIGRFVVRLRGKHNPPPRPPQPYIPVHFEDDEDEDDSEYYARPTAALEIPQEAAPARPVFNIPLELAEAKPVGLPAARLLPGANAPVANPPAGDLRDASGSGFLNLKQLSPLKQAVVMAEVLGPPKAFQ